jgi:hypothetical protein
MQNKPNLRKSQMNVNAYNTTDYENIANWTLGENKPNSNPIQSQSNPIQTQNKANTNPKQTQSNPILSASGGFKRGTYAPNSYFWGHPATTLRSGFAAKHEPNNLRAAAKNLDFFRQI